MMLLKPAPGGRFALLSLSLLPLLSGCGNGTKSTGQEIDLISEKPGKKVVLPKGTGPLWPLTPGKSWRTLTVRPGQKNVNSEIRVIGPYRMPDGRTGTVVHSYRSGKLFRVEVMQSDASGIKLLALGESGDKLLSFQPAIPFAKYPAKEGEYSQWSGTAKLGKQEFAATAFHRISAIDSVKTPFDTIRAYRLDGIISLLNASQRVDYPVVMWFVPGKGVAQRRLADRGVLALEVITKFPE
jgi:hypothetical protein